MYWIERTTKSKQEIKLNTLEMKILRWMSGHTKQNRITNESNKEKVEIVPIVENMVEYCIRWFGHVWRRHIETLVRRVDQMKPSPIVRGRERLRKI